MNQHKPQVEKHFIIIKLGIVDVLAPNEWEFHNRINPICDQATIVMGPRKEDFYKPYKIDYCGNIDLSGDGIPFFSPYKFYNKYSDGVGNKFNWSLIKFKTIWGE